MGREKKSLPAALVGGPKEKHRRAQRLQFDPNAPVPVGFVAKPSAPKTKYQSYFEFVENTDKKKKKLEFQVTGKKSPPPGFEFVPIGNPELTTACKNISRDKDAMIFIVSNVRDAVSTNLSHQVHRIGHHIRQTIVEEARAYLKQSGDIPAQPTYGQPEPIPESQTEYNLQVDAALRDLFPRIPNTDRQSIIEHAFQRGATFKGEKPVGRCEDMTLARRVQLAVLAHIRHNHTRYDQLLKETSWQNARKVVESLCLDILVKWRGDEETGRDQLDEILREVVIISDSEGEDSDMEIDDTSTEDTTVSDKRSSLRTRLQQPQQLRQTHANLSLPPSEAHVVPQDDRLITTTRAPQPTRATDKRGFRRYRAWEEAIRRNIPSQGNVHAHHHSTASGVGPVPGTMSRNTQGSAFVSVMEPLPNSTPRPHVFGDPLPRTLPHLDPSIPGQTTSLQVDTAAYEQHRQNGRDVHQRLTPVANGFQDLLVPSIEPVSPDAPQSYYIRTLPPRGHGSAPQSPIAAHPARYTRPVSPARDFGVAPASHFGRRIVSDHVSLGTGRHIDAVMTSNGSSLPRNYHGVPPRRTMFDAPRPGDRGIPILMEDRGGYYERVPIPPDAAAASRMPPFVQLRRAEPEYDGATHHAGPPHQAEPNMEENRRYFHSREGPHVLDRDMYVDNRGTSFPHGGPSRPMYAPPQSQASVIPHDAPRGWVSRGPEEPYHHGTQPNFQSGSMPEPPMVAQQAWTDRLVPGATRDTFGQREAPQHGFHTVDHWPRSNYNDATRYQHEPPERGHVVVLD